jgi:Ca2+-binding RTX toxin-like protein
MAVTLVVASGVAWAVNKIGTNGPDTLRGTNGDDTLSGRDGNDNLFSLDGRDTLLGGSGKDNVLGGERRPGGGDKNLVGGASNDVVIAGRGSDHALGGAGNDFLIDGNLRESSEDTLSGEPGNDVIIADHLPAFEDLVVCGPGFDWVLADSRDVVTPADCEKVRIVRGSRKQVLQQEDRFFESIPQSFVEGLPPPPPQ